MIRRLIFTFCTLAASLTLFAGPYEALIDSADNYAKMERWSDAERIYTEALQKYPASPLNSMIFSNIGVCRTNLGRYEEAIESFDIALIKSPESPRILCAKATACLLAGQDSVALASLNAAVRCDSISPIPRRLRGKILLVNKDLKRALDDFSVLSNVDPTDEWGPGGIGEVYMAMEKDAEAIPLLQKALSLNEDPDFRLSLASALLTVNRLADADELIRESIEKYPTTGEFYLLRGVLHRKFHLNNEAEYDILLAKKYGVDPQTVEKFLPKLTK